MSLSRKKHEHCSDEFQSNETQDQVLQLLYNISEICRVKQQIVQVQYRDTRPSVMSTTFRARQILLQT